MIKASSPKPASAPIVGADYNQLYEDVFANHAHSAARDGGLIDHDNLVENGNPMTMFNSHSQIDTHIGNISSAISGGVPWTKIHFGRHTLSNLNNPTGSRFTITFPNAFTRLPIVTISIQFLNANELDKISVMTPIYSLTLTGFGFDVIHPGLSGGNPGTYTFSGGAGWPPKTEVYINYIALEPPV